MTQQQFDPQAQQQWPYGGYPTTQQAQQPVAQQPQYPTQQQPYGQTYAPVPQPPQQGYGQPYAPQPQQGPPQQPLAQGTLEDYFNQPSAGTGPSVSWQGKPDGASIVGVVARDVQQGDVQQETNPQGIPQTLRDGSPKFVMKVPLRVQPSPEHPEGEATWYVKGQARDELVRAMAEAGAPAGAPKGGAVVQVTLTGRRQGRPGFNPSNQFAIRYTLPENAGQAPVQQQPVQQQPVQQPQGQQQPVQQMPVQQMPQAPAPQPAAAQPAPQMPQATQQPLPQQQPTQGQATQFPPDFDPAQQQLLAQLTGQQPPQQQAAS